MNRPAQVPLFDLLRRQRLHLWRAGALIVCAVCKASRAAVEAWDDCASCPGWVEPVPAGVTLDVLAELPAAAGPLEEREAA